MPTAAEIFLYFAFCMLRLRSGAFLHSISRSIKSLCYRFIFSDNSLVLRLTVCLEAGVKLGVGEGEDLCCKQSGIDASVYRNRSYRYASGHLYGGQKGFNAA